VVKEKLAQWEEKGLFLFFLPTYSPHLNPIEILWRFIKYKWLNKKEYNSWNSLKKAIFKYPSKSFAVFYNWSNGL